MNGTFTFNTNCSHFATLLLLPGFEIPSFSKLHAPQLITQVTQVSLLPEPQETLNNCSHRSLSWRKESAHDLVMKIIVSCSRNERNQSLHMHTHTHTHLRNDTSSHRPCPRHVSGVCLACAYKLSHCFHLLKMSNVSACDGDGMHLKSVSTLGFNAV